VIEYFVLRKSCHLLVNLSPQKWPCGNWMFLLSHLIPTQIWIHKVTSHWIKVWSFKNLIFEIHMVSWIYWCNWHTNFFLIFSKLKIEYYVLKLIGVEMISRKIYLTVNFHLHILRCKGKMEIYSLGQPYINWLSFVV
jgi:hypothetical protein